MINKLKPNQIFIFGSNLAGHHIGGAAKQAYQDFGAEWCIGEGLTGQCYAFPTLDVAFRKMPKSRLKTSRVLLYETANAHPDKEFLLTKVGCGIAGFDEEYMKKLFKNAPSNIIKPDDWR